MRIGSREESAYARGEPRSLTNRVVIFLVAVLLIVGAIRATDLWMRRHRPAPAPPALRGSASEAAAEARELVAFYEQRLRRDPGDSDVYSKLAGLYLQRLRETGALEDLGLALRASRASLAIVPAVRNVDGLTSLTLAEFASHEFAPARDHAMQLTKLDYSGTPYALLGDAFAELGDYGKAAQAYEQMARRSGAADENVATRMARVAQLRGDNLSAERDFAKALALELSRHEPSLERTAWFYWQLGDTAFFTGDLPGAGKNYDAALAAYPGYFRALASRGRLDAARGNLSAAIGDYEAAVQLLPDPTFIAELGDVYKLARRNEDARRQYELVEFIGHLSKLNGVMYNRQIAMFYADHDLKPAEAYADARREYRVRRDILGADALAWTAFKAGEVRIAQVAMKAALRLGTRDPRLFYHAGMIARAAGNRDAARANLQRALTLNPEFDPLQAIEARRALRTLDGSSAVE